MFNIVIFISIFVYCSAETRFYHLMFSDVCRIVDGDPVDIDSHPYQLALEYDEMYLCGASIINTSWAITAAQCIPDGLSKTEYYKVKLRAGSSTMYRGGSLHSASLIIVHPNFTGADMNNDVALIKVAKPFQYGKRVQPVSLAPTEPSAGTEVIVTGWGATADGSPMPEYLQMAILQILDKSDCAKLFAVINRNITETQICAGTIQKECTPVGCHDKCFGDGGGPLVEKEQLVGLVSWGWGCGDKEFPGVYTSVAVLKSWITCITESK